MRYGVANICIVCSIRVGACRDGCVVERGYVQFVSFTKAVISGILKWYGVRVIFSPVVSSMRPFVARSCAQDHNTMPNDASVLAILSVPVLPSPATIMEPASGAMNVQNAI